MNSVDVKCPICGAMNESLNLEETDGWMECEISLGIRIVITLKTVKNQKKEKFNYGKKSIDHIDKSSRRQQF